MERKTAGSRRLPTRCWSEVDYYRLPVGTVNFLLGVVNFLLASSPPLVCPTNNWREQEVLSAENQTGGDPSQPVCGRWGQGSWLCVSTVKCNRQFMTDDDDKSHTITPQRVDMGWGRGGGGVGGGARVSQMGSWNVMST